MDVHLVLAATPLPDMPDCWSVLLHLPPEPGFPAGRQHDLRFPHEALHWRAAEYGIDPHDSATLLDIVMYEPHMHDHDAHSPDFLYRTDQETARLGHLARVQAIQRDRVRVVDPDGHLGAIHAAHTVDPFDHQVRCERVLAYRAGNNAHNIMLNRG